MTLRKLINHLIFNSWYLKLNNPKVIFMADGCRYSIDSVDADNETNKIEIRLSYQDDGDA